MATPRVDFIQADPAWRCIDFLSDIHLDERDQTTFEAWRAYLLSTPADALFILGDLFEVWVGDDTPEVFSQNCVALLQALQKVKPVFVMHGNRDFLLGSQHAYSFQIIQDPCVLAFNGRRVLLSHGDTWCTEDHAYQQFRAQVRTPLWQENFLKQNWEMRHALGQAMRQQSLAQQATQKEYADVNPNLALQALIETRCDTLIHGHTHRPATHHLDDTHQRWVLSDWHAQSDPPRLEVLRWQQPNAHATTKGFMRVHLKP
jgi:UDP-2,3-diacylglucosamine hydrolase